MNKIKNWLFPKIEKNCKTISNDNFQIVFDEGISSEIKCIFYNLTRNLLDTYEVQAFLKIYVINKEEFKLDDGYITTCDFYGPVIWDDFEKVPEIKIAIGDYDALVREDGVSNILYFKLSLFISALVDYFIWNKYPGFMNHRKWDIIRIPLENYYTEKISKMYFAKIKNCPKFNQLFDK